MCHEVYETSVFDMDKSQAFSHWYQTNIGGYFERNSTEDGFYFVCVELNPKDIDEIRAWENTYDN